MTFIPNSDFFLNVRKGNITKHSTYQINGYNTSVGTTFEHVWAYTGGDLTWQTSSVAYDVTSTSADDASAGSGVRTLLIEGLDNTGAIQTETISTNGSTIVTTANSYRRLNRVTAKTNGTYGGSNLGDITIRQTGGGNIQGFMPAGAGVTQKSHYTVPLGYTAHVVSINITVDTNKSTSLELNKREDMLTTSAPTTSSELVHRWDGIVSPSIEPIVANHKFDALTDIWTEAKVNSGTAIVQTDFEIILIQD